MARGSVIESKLRVTLDNQVSAEARKVAGSVKDMEHAANAQARAMADARGRMLDAVAVGYAAYRAFEAPVAAAVDFQRQLENVRQKADMTREAVTSLGIEAKQLGLDTAQGASSIADAIDVLLGTGLVDAQQALAISNPLGKVATAYEADTTDIANATASIVGNMNVAVEEVSKAYDIMAQAGKSGQFELKDMAKEFPSLTAAAKALGIEGTKGLADMAAALQIARTGAASGSEAATNMANFMNKVMAPDAIKKFGAAGVNIVEEMRAATEAGISPLERALDIMNKLTDGGDQAKMGQFFADSEVQKFLRPMLANMEEYRRIRADALAADGVVQADFESRLQTPGGAIARFQASIENFNITVGDALLPKLTEFINAVTPMVDGVSRFVDANDELVAAILEMVAAIVAMRVAAAAAGYLGAFMGVGGKPSGLLAAGSQMATGAGAGSAAGAAAGATGLMAAGNSLMSTWMGKAMGLLGMFEGAKYAQSIGALQGPNGDRTWDHNVVHMLDPTLAKIIYEGYNPLPNMGVAVGGLTDRTLTGGPASEEIAQIRKLISDSESGLSPIHPIEMTALREELAALEQEAKAAGNDVGAGIQSGLASQTPAVIAEMQSIMARMRVAAAAGVSIPIHTGPRAATMPGRNLPAFAGGGRVAGAGGGTSDDVLAWLSNGEYVVNADAARQYAGLLDGINSGNMSSLPAGRQGAGPGGAPQLLSLSLNLGGVSISGVADAEAAFQMLKNRLATEVKDALSGIYADIEYTG